MSLARLAGKRRPCDKAGRTSTLAPKGRTMLRAVTATRYVTPLREGGSLPGLVEADDDGLYVVKFRGAGQGPKALVAEVIAGEIGRTLGLPVPELVTIEVAPGLVAGEADPEIQELLERSAGVNLGMDFLPGSLPVGDPAGAGIPPHLVAEIVWFDALVSNVDRTARNPNLLLWHRRLWLIDHGAALYQHHGWTGAAVETTEAPRSRFPAIRQQVLLPIAGAIDAVDARLAARLDPATIRGLVELVPDSWLEGVPPYGTAATHRAAYVAYLTARLAPPREWVEEAEAARQEAVGG